MDKNKSQNIQNLETFFHKQKFINDNILLKFSLGELKQYKKITGSFLKNECLSV